MTSNGFVPVYGIMVRYYIGAQAEGASARRGNKVGPYKQLASSAFPNPSGIWYTFPVSCLLQSRWSFLEQLLLDNIYNTLQASSYFIYKRTHSRVTVMMYCLHRRACQCIGRGKRASSTAGDRQHDRQGRNDRHFDRAPP